jgi:GNAT superfamily N-acetyltransferase
MYTKRIPHEVNLHVYEEGHPEIVLNLLFRDCLRTSGETRSAYGALKATLAQAHDATIKPQGAMFQSYTLGKDPFITGVLDAAGFSLQRFMKVSSPREWDAYHTIFKSQIFDPLGLIYDAAHPSFSGPNNHRFAWCKGVSVVSGAHVEKMSESVAALRGLATHGDHQRQGYGRQLMGNIERWLKKEGIAVIKMHARPSALSFYTALGYGPMVFDDPSIQTEYVDLGKVL